MIGRKYMMLELEHKVAIVTGAGSGIGRAIAQELARLGATVVGAGRRAQPLDETRELIAETGGGEFVAMVLDVSVEPDVVECLAKVERLGPVEIVVNNAGCGMAASLLETRTEDWDAQMAANARAMFLMMRETARVMVPRGRGDIINLSSLAGKHPIAGFSAYAASKFAAVGFTASIARELRRSGIRVTSLCPGAVATDFRKASFPEEDAAAITQPGQLAALIGFLLTSGAGMRELSLDVS